MKYFMTIFTILLALAFSADVFAGDPPMVTGESYFDVATGHRYIRNSDSTYREYTKKGELFRASVSPDLPLLATNKNIREISKNCFMLYEKRVQNELRRQILSASRRHPRGWTAKTTVIECGERTPIETALGTMGLGYSTGSPFDSGIPVATGESYFDRATGHRYMKNSDGTYREFTRKGELFRVAVSPDLPLLTTNKNIREIGQSCFLLYQKKAETLVLPSGHGHPKGWSVEAMLISLAH